MSTTLVPYWDSRKRGTIVRGVNRPFGLAFRLLTVIEKNGIQGMA